MPEGLGALGPLAGMADEGVADDVDGGCATLTAFAGTVGDGVLAALEFDETLVALALTQGLGGVVEVDGAVLAVGAGELLLLLAGVEKFLLGEVDALEGAGVVHAGVAFEAAVVLESGVVKIDLVLLDGLDGMVDAGGVDGLGDLGERAIALLRLRGALDGLRGLHGLLGRWCLLLVRLGCLPCGR